MIEVFLSEREINEYHFVMAAHVIAIIEVVEGGPVQYDTSACPQKNCT